MQANKVFTEKCSHSWAQLTKKCSHSWAQLTKKCSHSWAQLTQKCCHSWAQLTKKVKSLYPQSLTVGRTLTSVKCLLIGIGSESNCFGSTKVIDNLKINVIVLSHP